MNKTALLLIAFATMLSSAEEAAPVNDPAFHVKLLEVATTYEKFGRVDDQARFAPTLCRAAPPSVARVSASKDAPTHGQKLYFLFAKDRGAYLKVDQESAVGQSVVKESWVPKEVTESDATKQPLRKVVELTDEEKKALQVDATADNFLPYAKKNGKVYHAETKGALFVMLKLDPKTPSTDDGWVYGTVTADGKTVTSAGRVQSCMSCHKDAPHGRLFGLKTETAEKSEKAVDPAAVKKMLGGWGGKWVDNWHYAGQGGEMTATFSAGDGTDVKAEFKAPGFMKDPVNLTLKIRTDGEALSTSGALEMGKPAGMLTFRCQISGDKFTGDYSSPEERGTFEMTKK